MAEAPNVSAVVAVVVALDGRFVLRQVEGSAPEAPLLTVPGYEDFIAWHEAVSAFVDAWLGHSVETIESLPRVIGWDPRSGRAREVEVVICHLADDARPDVDRVGDAVAVSVDHWERGVEEPPYDAVTAFALQRLASEARRHAPS